MTEFWSLLVARATAAGSLYLVGALIVVLALAAAFARQERKRARTLVLLTVMHLLLLPITVALEAAGGAGGQALRVATALISVFAFVGMAGLLLFAIALPRMRLRAPRIVQDVVMAAAAIVGCVAMASRAGFNPSGVIATSAVLTAAIGLAFQDTLGNVIGGLALQTDNSISVGEWIKVGEITGKVLEIRWRYTAIGTRDGELVLIPNGVLMKGQVTILARGITPGRWRRTVTFRVDFRYQPSDVIDVVNKALRAAPVQPNGALDPQPYCFLYDIGESQCLFGARYWLTDPTKDNLPDSVVRTRIFFALARAGIKLSMPAHAVFLTNDDQARGQEKSQAQFDRQLSALREVELLSTLTDEDLLTLAAGLRYAPFTAGEVMTRQGDIAHWLYLIIDGEASVRVRSEDGGAEREVSKLHPGMFFGEMSLLTGEPRAASVVALSDVECYRLGAEPFRKIMLQRPEHAQHFAEVLAERKVSLDAAKQDLDAAARAKAMAAHKQDLLAKIRSFLTLAGDE